jgi:hypothetical protein
MWTAEVKEFIVFKTGFMQDFEVTYLIVHRMLH